MTSWEGIKSESSTGNFLPGACIYGDQAGRQMIENLILYEWLFEWLSHFMNNWNQRLQAGELRHGLVVWTLTEKSNHSKFFCNSHETIFAGNVHWYIDKKGSNQASHHWMYPQRVHTSPAASINVENSSIGVTYIFWKLRGPKRRPNWLSNQIFY